jgi:hypothetical protein
MKLHKLYISAVLLTIAACAHGPKVTVCSSNPSQGQFNCANSSGPVASVTYAQSVGYSVYPPQGEQSLLDYCAKRNQDGTEPPQFSKCSTDLVDQGFSCTQEICGINGFNDGLVCTAGTISFVPFSASENYLAFSAADNQTLLDYCNIKIEN